MSRNCSAYSLFFPNAVWKGVLIPCDVIDFTMKSMKKRYRGCISVAAQINVANVPSAFHDDSHYVLKIAILFPSFSSCPSW
jgi:hypothetical protein